MEKLPWSAAAGHRLDSYPGSAQNAKTQSGVEPPHSKATASKVSRLLMIHFRCDCGRLLQAKEELAGRLTRCPDCGREMKILEAGEAIEPAGPGPRRQAPRDAYAEEERDRDREPAIERRGGRSGKALASLILGITSFVCIIFTGIPAIICGIMALRDIGGSRGRLHGTGMAVTGIVLAAITSILILPAGLLGLLLPAVQKVREAANRMACQQNLKQLAIAMHNYHDVHGSFPPAVVRDKNGKPLYSWRVLLLPYMEEQPLFQQFKLDEPWDSPNNIKLLDRMPRVFTDPGAAMPDAHSTFYQVFVGPKTAFEDAAGQNLATFTDGPGNTILIVEAAKAVPWTKPEDLGFDPNAPLPALGGQHVNGYNAALADGAVHFLPRDTDERTLRGLITRNGGEAVTPP